MDHGLVIVRVHGVQGMLLCSAHAALLEAPTMVPILRHSHCGSCIGLQPPSTSLLLHIVLVEDVPVGLIIVGVREAQAALLRNAGGLAEGHHIGVPPGGGAVGAAAVDDPLVVHCDVACTQTPEHFGAPLYTHLALCLSAMHAQKLIYSVCIALGEIHSCSCQTVPDDASAQISVAGHFGTVNLCAAHCMPNEYAKARREPDNGSS